MKPQSHILFLLLAVILSGCWDGGMKPVRAVSIKGHFALKVPSNFRMRNDLHDFAPLQMADEANGYFLVALEEDKQSLRNLQLKYTLADYADFSERNIAKGFDTIHIAQRDTFFRDDLAFQTVDLHAHILSEHAPLEVFYHIAAIESEDRFFQLIAWCRRHRSERLRSAMELMEASFLPLTPEKDSLAGPSTEQTASIRPRP